MDVWLTWCKRKTKCKYCPEPINPGEPVVVAKQWRKKASQDARHWPFILRFHPNCWLENALAYLEKHPYVPKRSMGRPKLDLSKDDKTKRLRMLRLRASIVYRQKVAAHEGRALRVLELEVRKQELIGEIEKCGGVPKSWEV